MSNKKVPPTLHAAFDWTICASFNMHPGLPPLGPEEFNMTMGCMCCLTKRVVLFAPISQTAWSCLLTPFVLLTDLSLLLRGEVIDDVESFSDFFWRFACMKVVYNFAAREWITGKKAEGDMWCHHKGGWIFKSISKKLQSACTKSNVHEF